MNPFSRIVALLLVPCLIVDPSLAATAPIFLHPKNTLPPPVTQELFRQQAIVSQIINVLTEVLPSKPKAGVMRWIPRERSHHSGRPMVRGDPRLAASDLRERTRWEVERSPWEQWGVGVRGHRRTNSMDHEGRTAPGAPGQQQGERDLMTIKMEPYQRLAHKTLHDNRASQIYVLEMTAEIRRTGRAYKGFRIPDIRRFMEHFNSEAMKQYLFYDMHTSRFRNYSEIEQELDNYDDTAFILRRSLEDPTLLEFIPREDDELTVILDSGGIEPYRSSGERLSTFIDQVLSVMGITMSTLVDSLKQHGPGNLAILLDPDLDAPEETFVSRGTVHLNSRLLEPGFEDVLRGAIVKIIANVMAGAPAGPDKQIKTIPHLFTYWVVLSGIKGVRNALLTLGEGAFLYLGLFRSFIEAIEFEWKVFFSGRDIRSALSADEARRYQSQRLAAWFSDEANRETIESEIRKMLRRLENKYRGFQTGEDGRPRDLMAVKMDDAPESPRRPAAASEPKDRYSIAQDIQKAVKLANESLGQVYSESVIFYGDLADSRNTLGKAHDLDLSIPVPFEQGMPRLKLRADFIKAFTLALRRMDPRYEFLPLDLDRADVPEMYSRRMRGVYVIQREIFAITADEIRRITLLPAPPVPAPERKNPEDTPPLAQFLGLVTAWWYLTRMIKAFRPEASLSVPDRSLLRAA